MNGVKKVFLVLFFILYVVCNLVLIVLPLLTSYTSGTSYIPSIVQMALNSNQGVLKAFTEAFESTLPFVASASSFWKSVGGFLCFAMTVASPVFVILSFIPFLKNFKYTFRGSKNIEDKTHLNITREAFTCIRRAIHRLLWSQSVHFFYFICGLTEQNFGTVRLSLYITMAVCFVFISELHGNNALETVFSLSYKVFKHFLGSMLLLAPMILCYHYIPKTVFCQILITVWVIGAIDSSLLFEQVDVNEGLFKTLYDNEGYCVMICVSFVLYLICSLIGGLFSINIIAVFLIAFLGALIVSAVYQFIYSDVAAKYPEMNIEYVVLGYRSQKKYVRSRQYKRGFPFAAFGYFAKLLLFLIIFAASAIVAQIFSNVIFVILLGLSTKIAVVVGHILVMGVGALEFWLMWTKYCDYKEYVVNCWALRKSVTCTAFSTFSYTLLFALISSPLLFIPVEIRPHMPTSALTYIIIFCNICLLAHIIYSGTNIKSAAKCDRCKHYGYHKVVSESTRTYQKRHIEHVKGHYVQDHATTTTQYSTEGTTTHALEHYSYSQPGIPQGESRGQSTSRYNTKKTETTTISRWVDGYDVDEGVFEHSVTDTTLACRVCGCRSSYSRDTKKRKIRS